MGRDFPKQPFCRGGQYYEDGYMPSEVYGHGGELYRDGELVDPETGLTEMEEAVLDYENGLVDDNIKHLPSAPSYKQQTIGFVEHGWHTGINPKDNLIKKCDWAEENVEKKIIIEYDVYKAIRTLCSKIVLEWQMLLIGEHKDGIIRITDYYVPKQKVTGATVENIDCIDKKFVEENKVVASIHSHGSMGVFFSTTDDDYTNLCGLISYHICVNNKDDYNGICILELPCGKKKMQDIDIEIETLEEDTVEVRGIENIEKKTYIYPATKYNGGKNDVSRVHKGKNNSAKETFYYG